MRSLRTALLLSLLAAAALLAAGCGGGGGGNSGDARALIDKAFKTPIGSANVGVNIELSAQGVPQLSQPARLKLSGPYQSNGKGKLPSLNWQITGAAAGQSFSAAFVSTGDNAFVGFRGQNYEVGKPQVAQLNTQLGRQSSQQRSLKQFGIDPQNWVKDPQTKGDENVNGVPTTHVTANVDVGRMLSDVSTGVQKAGTMTGRSSTQLTPAQIDKAKQYVKNPKFDLWVGKDNKVRRLAVSVDFSVPAGQQSKANGLKGGSVNLTVDFSNVGQRQTITAPANPKPLSALTGQLGGLGGLGGFGGGSSGGTGATPGGTGGTGGAATPNQQKLQRYSACVSKANPSDASAIQKCTALLR